MTVWEPVKAGSLLYLPSYDKRSVFVWWWMMNHVKELVQAQEVYRQGYTGKGIRIAVLDTGVYAHRDLKGRIAVFQNFMGENQALRDDNGHGTHVAGILCGDGTCSRGVVRGMAPGAQLAVLKVLDKSGNGKTEKVLFALDWMKKNHALYGIRLLNFSVGFLQGADNEAQYEIMCGLEELWDRGVTVVTAAGNNGPGEGTITVPGISRKVITVGACDDERGGRGMPKGYSGRGPTGCCIVKPEILAPGTNILSLSSRGNQYVQKSGTSMATPIVCGALALALEKDPSLRPEHLKLKLYESLVVGRERKGPAWGIIAVDNLMKLI